MSEPVVLPFTNPATGQRFGEIAMATPDEIQHALSDMRSTARLWSCRPVEERVRVLRQFQEVLIDARDEISAVINQDCGKSRQDALIEVFITADILNEYCRHAAEWLRPQRVSRGLYLFKQGLIEYQPHGVVAVISPWNYPFALSMPPVIAALLAGNTVVLKPSEVTAATGALIERLFKRVPELSPFVRVLHGDGSVGAAMIKAKPDFIFLTGSTATGKKVMLAAAEHMIPVTCELGGKDALIVLEDADIRAAAKWAVWGAFFNTGQTCMAVERAYVVEPVYDQFVQAAVHFTQEVKVGYTPEKDSPYYLGSMTFPRQVEIVEQHLRDALEKGAHVLTGGRRQAMFIEPTVMVDVTHDMLLMRDETFGPILPIVKVRDEREAIDMANDSTFGLGASVWSADLGRAQRVARELQAGSVLINDTICQFAVPMLPFGGVKQSGIGRVHGKEGLMQFAQSHAYLVGQPPAPFDVATVLRKPGHYDAAAAIMRLAFGATPRQRLEPVSEVVTRVAQKADRRTVGAVFGVIGTLAGLAYVLSRGRSKSKR
jgi:acyl-CoA reductase-like NAD-dependent aldehyde dehydrogenase